MKKVFCVLAALMLCMVFAVPTLAENQAGVIQVGGSATVSLAADTATVQIGVNTQRETVREAQRENADIMAAVMEAIRALGIDDKDIVTSQFEVYSGYDYSVDGEGREIRTQYYQVQNIVTVTLHDLTLIGAVLDAAMEAGANTTYGITFTSTQANEAYQKALTRAVEDAMQKAQVLADAAHVKLGKLKSINSEENMNAWARESYGASNTYYYEAKAMDAGTTITSGDVSVSANVVLEYEFEN